MTIEETVELIEVDDDAFEDPGDTRVDEALEESSEDGRGKDTVNRVLSVLLGAKVGAWLMGVGKIIEDGLGEPSEGKIGDMFGALL